MMDFPSKFDSRSDPTAPKVWFITGTSAGLGRLLVKEVVERGDYAIASARNIAAIKDLETNPDESGSSNSNAWAKGQCRTICLDVSSPFESIRGTIVEAMKFWGRIDVLVHNAGNAMLGISEEIGFEGYQMQFATNFYGPLNITHAVLPYMRAARSGTVVFVGSRSSWKANVLMLGPYASSKAALSAAAGALAIELAPLGIRVLEICPGSMRTRNFENLILLPVVPNASSGEPLAENKQYTDEPNDGEEDHIADYAPYRMAQIEFLRTLNGTQPGDPTCAAKAIVNLVRAEGEFAGYEDGVKSGDGANPWSVAAAKSISVMDGSDKHEDAESKELPNLLVLGGDAQRDVRNKCMQVLQGIDEWEEVGRSIDFAHSE